MNKEELVTFDGIKRYIDLSFSSIENNDNNLMKFCQKIDIAEHNTTYHILNGAFSVNERKELFNYRIKQLYKVIEKEILSQMDAVNDEI